MLIYVVHLVVVVQGFCTRLGLLAGTAAAGMLLPCAAFAQSAGTAPNSAATNASPAEGLADIIVTARKRAQKTQDVRINFSGGPRREYSHHVEAAMHTIDVLRWEIERGRSLRARPALVPATTAANMLRITSATIFR